MTRAILSDILLTDLQYYLIFYFVFEGKTPEERNKHYIGFHDEERKRGRPRINSETQSGDM